MAAVVRQASVASDSGAASPATLNSDPVEGNLMYCWISERNGATSSFVYESGWTQCVDFAQSPTNSTYRKYTGVFWKIASASESRTVNLDTDASSTNVVGIVEIESDSGETFSYVESVTVGSDTPSTSYTSGNTSSLVGAPFCLIGLCYTKPVSSSEIPYSTWTNGLVEFAFMNEGNNARDFSAALGNVATDGVKSTIASTSGTAAARGSILALSVFKLTGGTPPTTHTFQEWDGTTLTDLTTEYWDGSVFTPYEVVEL